ncbi:patatin-like phospholipase family protein [Mycobacterium sp.]|uniref:patatin-like phospholipase family protein n=1 Tax=Mycobacterium sp. TaxID=1785 RepID=UPI002C8B131C|nr:patatin-like phospholipase family protein [Mycobacterium sp.]HME46729.1 patatin-like phospholipase family protein [Mycobacterium sp.]
MLDELLDIFRLRQYFNVITRTREWVEGLRGDAAFVADAGRAALHLPSGGATTGQSQPFPPPEPYDTHIQGGQRIALAATGGSGAMASVVGAARALEEAGLRPSVISLCSGSALFGFPVAAGISAETVAAFALGLRPRDYIDVDWRRLMRAAPTIGTGFAGILGGDAVETTYRRLLGDMTLGELPIPAYAPIWNVEQNRIEFIGPRTHPELPVARAVHMAVALPLFIQPVEFAGFHWCDGGIVDIFPVRPLLDLEEPCDFTLAINGFYPPGFEGEDATGWEYRPASILYVASQVRTCQQIELARENLARLRAASHVAMIEPVPYEAVRGVGFYRQFFSTRDWAAFMQAGRLAARQALASTPIAVHNAAQKRQTARSRPGGAPVR